MDENDGKEVTRDLEVPQKVELSVSVKEMGEGSRLIEFAASTEKPDRSMDIIDVAGWELENWNKNPVIPRFHNYYELPVGKGIRATKDLVNKVLKVLVYFPTIDELCSDPSNPSKDALFIDTVYNMYKIGMLNAVSVGYKPKQFKTRDDPAVLEKPEWMRGVHFLKQELLELSVVLVPCNEEALVLEKSGNKITKKGLDIYKEFLTEETGGASMTIVERIKAFEDEIAKLKVEMTKAEGFTVEKAGAKFSKETKEALAKVAEALDLSVKAIKECHKAVAEMIADPPAQTEKPEGDEGEGEEEGKELLDFETASMEDVAAKLFV